MDFLQHLQSSLILGTKMSHPEEKYFEQQQCNELFDALKDENIDKIKKIIENGTDPDRCEHNHFKLLCYAVEQNLYKAVKELLKYGVDTNFTDCFGKKALDYAIEAKNEEMIKLLKKYHAISLKNDKYNSSVHFDAKNIQEAVLLGELNAVAYYHQLGSSLQQKTDKTTLLHLSIESNNHKVMIYLLNKGINIDITDKSGSSVLMLCAMKAQKYKFLKTLIKRGATLNQRNNQNASALTIAIKYNNIKAAILLVKKGADVNIRDNAHTPLTLTHKAILKAKSTELKEELRELETLLLTKFAHVNSSDDKLLWTPLILTASHYQDNANIEHLNLLISLGANINQIDKNGRTALMISSSLGRVEAVEILIKYGANLNISDKFGWTALMLAVYYNQKNIVKTLLYSGADVNYSAKKGLNAIKIAIDNDRVSLISILKDFGAFTEKK